jgi:hypothetical protein
MMVRMQRARSPQSRSADPNSSFRGEYPPEALQRLMQQESERAERERRIARRRADAAWLTGVPWIAGEDGQPLPAAVLALTEVERRAATVGEASAWLAVGLELRADRACLLRGSDWRTYRRLLAQGATMRPGVGVCEDCRRVFRTARRGVAFKCPRCHARSTPTRRKPWHLHVADEETFDPDTGQPSGWQRRRYLVQCVGCGVPFWADRRDRKTCSLRCRVRAHRARK